MLTFLRLSGLSLALVLLLAAHIHADTFLGPYACLYSSADRQYGMKVLPPKRRPHDKPTSGYLATGILFYLQEDGKEKILWNRSLINFPGRVLIEDLSFAQTPLVLTLGNWAYTSRSDETHWLVLYSRDGRVIQDLKLPELVNREELEEILKANPRPGLRNPVVEWMSTATYAFRGGDLVIHLRSGRVIRIDGANGKLLGP